MSSSPSGAICAASLISDRTSSDHRARPARARDFDERRAEGMILPQQPDSPVRWWPSPELSAG